MSDNRFMLTEALKAQQWELAKGHLRALVALQGSYQSPNSTASTHKRWVTLDMCVQEFILFIENDSLQE